MTEELKESHELLKQAAEYVASTEPVLEKQAEMNERFCEQLTKTAETLVSRGLLTEEKKEEFVNKSAEDHTFVLAYLDRLAGSVGAENLGTSTNLTKSAEPTDDFERLFVDPAPGE